MNIVRITLKRSAPIDGTWRAPGWSGEVSDAVARQLDQNGKVASVVMVSPPGPVGEIQPGSPDRPVEYLKSRRAKKPE